MGCISQLTLHVTGAGSAPGLNGTVTVAGNTVAGDTFTVDRDGTSQTNYYADNDGDGYGYGAATPSCDPVLDTVVNATDCNDTNAAINPATGDCDISLADADAKLIGDDPSDYVGMFLTAAGDTNGDGYGDFLVGVHGEDLSGASSSEGVAYVMCGPVAESATFADSCADIYGARAATQAGSGVADLGDIDGDGYDDVAVGLNSPTSVAVFQGPLSGSYSSAAADATVTMLTLGDIAGAGDVDGDGSLDLLVGVAYDDAAATDAGAVYLIPVPTTGTVDLASATASIYGEAASDYAGSAIAGGADFDGDGLHDIAVGAPYVDVDGTDSIGVVYGLLGPVTGAVGLADADARFEGEVSSDNAYGYPIAQLAGVSISDAGDVNDDGYSDLLIGASYAGFNRNGCAYLQLGPLSTSGGLADADAVIEHRDDGASFGDSVAGVGDVNEDGYSDILIHAADAGEAYAYPGANYVFFGPISGVIDDGDANGTLTGEAYYDAFFGVVAGAGDVDADGRDDLLIGVSRHDAGGTDAGAVYLVLGSNF